MPEEQSIKQKMMAFAASGDIGTVLAILKECTRQAKLVGETEYETVVNAVTLDAQSDMLIKFINRIDFIKQGGLLTEDHG